MGCSTSRRSPLTRMQGFAPLSLPSYGAGFPATTIYASRYRFLKICSREFCVNCRGDSSPSAVTGSCAALPVRRVCLTSPGRVARDLSLAPEGVSAQRAAVPTAGSLFARLGHLLSFHTDERGAGAFVVPAHRRAGCCCSGGTCVGPLRDGKSPLLTPWPRVPPGTCAGGGAGPSPAPSWCQPFMPPCPTSLQGPHSEMLQ